MSSLRILLGYILIIAVMVKTERDCIQYKNCQNLTITVQQGNMSRLTERLDVCDVNSVDEDNRTVLNQAVRMTRPDMVFLLLDRGADPNRADPGGLTPLHLAANSSHTGVAMEIVTHLLLRGARRMATDDQGCIPLHLAARRGHITSARLLLTACDPTCRMDQLLSHDTCVVGSPASHAMQQGKRKMASWLDAVKQEATEMLKDDTSLHESPNVNCADMERDWKNVTAIKILLKSCRVDKVDGSGSTKLLRATDKDFPDVVFTLLTYGANVNQPNKLSYSPLHAVKKSSAAGLILLHRPDRFFEDADGQISLHIAAAETNLPLARLLLSDCDYKCKLRQLRSRDDKHRRPVESTGVYNSAGVSAKEKDAMRTLLTKQKEEASVAAFIDEQKRDSRGKRSLPRCGYDPAEAAKDGEDKCENSNAQLRAQIDRIDTKLTTLVNIMHQLQNVQTQGRLSKAIK